MEGGVGAYHNTFYPTYDYKAIWEAAHENTQ
jgi:hypothetical protein